MPPMREQVAPAIVSLAIRSLARIGRTTCTGTTDYLVWGTLPMAFPAPPERGWSVQLMKMQGRAAAALQFAKRPQQVSALSHTGSS